MHVIKCRPLGHPRGNLFGSPLDSGMHRVTIQAVDDDNRLNEYEAVVNRVTQQVAHYSGPPEVEDFALQFANSGEHIAYRVLDEARGFKVAAVLARGRLQPGVTCCSTYEEAIQYLRSRLGRAAKTTAYRIYENGELVLEVWHDAGRWVDRGKYA